MQYLKENDDWVLFSKMKQNEASAFEEFYAKYASMMFGCILEICKEEDLASTIFKKVFLNLKDVSLSKTQVPFSFWLWQHTGSETKKHISTDGTRYPHVEYKEAMIEFLCFNKAGRDEAAIFFKIDNENIGRCIKKELQYSN